MSSKRVLITAGGTGGHLYPAQALADQLSEQGSNLLFVAGGLKINRYFDTQRFPFREIPCSPLVSRNPSKCFKGIKDLLKGITNSVAIIKEYRPDVVVGFGSYYTVPILLAAGWLKVPVILHEANSIPGKANKWLAPLATHIGVHFPVTKSFFKGKSVEVGLPLRAGYHLGAMGKEEALAHYGLSPHRRTLLVCGGSQGARAINDLIEKCLPILKKNSLQVIHSTGDVEKANALTTLYAKHQVPACVKAFESQMHIAWSAADAFIGRSGAATIAESLEFEVPGILIPYPFATDQHQEKNADFLIETVKSGSKLLELGLTSDILSKTIEQLFEGTAYLRFKEALRAHKKRPRQLTLCQLVLEGV